MNGMLGAGQVLATESGDDKVTVEALLGHGGQGEVYRVRTRAGSYALKWYYPQLADARQRAVLQTLIERNWGDDRFLWPEALVIDPAAPRRGFGYLMGLRPDRFSDLPALFRRDPRVAATTPLTLVTAALHTAEAYRALHAKGIAYRDINWGNIFFDPANGDVLICDNDNALVDGEDTTVAGTMDFMAPELVRGDPGARPSTQTDLHSLAVLLFMLLMNHHPLEGALQLAIRCLDENAKRRLYGTRPLFVYDPSDTRNRPVPGEQDTVIATWQLLPRSLRRLFETAFTAGLADPNARVRETVWRDALSEVRDAVIPCGHCGKLNMTEPGAVPPDCWKCARPVTLPPRLEVRTGMSNSRARSVYLHPRAQVYAHHLVGEPDRHDFTAVVGEVTEHPTQPGRFGLTNRSDRAWTVRRQDGTLQTVEPGRTAAIRLGLLLEFGDGAEAEVRPPRHG